MGTGTPTGGTAGKTVGGCTPPFPRPFLQRVVCPSLPPTWGSTSSGATVTSVPGQNVYALIQEPARMVVAILRGRHWPMW